MTLDARGLTLAEVVAAAMIVGIGLAGLMIVVPIGSFGLAEGNQLTTATFLAEERLEHVRNAPWTSSPDNDCVGIGPTAARPTASLMASTTLGGSLIVPSAIASGGSDATPSPINEEP